MERPGAGGWPLQIGIGRLLGRGWALFREDAMKYVGMSLLLSVPLLIATFEPFWHLFLLVIPLPEGMMMYVLKRIKGAEPEIGDVSRVFSVFLSLLLVRIVGSLLSAIGFLLLIIPGIYLSVAYVLAFPLVLDRGVGFWEALETSRKVVTARWWTVFGLMVILALINSVGYASVVGWLIAFPFSLCVIVALYDAALGVTGDGARL